MSDLQITAELTNGTIYNINMSLATRDSDTYNTGLGRKGFDCSNPINDALILANIMSAGRSNRISNITFNFLNGYNYNYAFNGSINIANINEFKRNKESFTRAGT